MVTTCQPSVMSDGSTTAGASSLDSTPRQSLAPETDEAYLMTRITSSQIRAQFNHMTSQDRCAREKAFMMSTDMPDSTTWYLVAVSWLVRWKDYLRGEQPAPGPIDNGELIDNQGFLRPCLQACQNYRGLSYLQWLFLEGLYGGGPEIKIFNVDANGVVQVNAESGERCRHLVKCRNPTCLDCSARRDARVLLGMAATGPCPDIAQVAARILHEKESEILFLNLLHSPRLGELQTLAAARCAQDIFLLIAEVKDKQLQQVCSDRVNDFAGALNGKIKLRSSHSDPMAILVGAANAANQKAVTRSIEALDCSMTSMHAVVKSLKRKMTAESPTPCRAKLLEVAPFHMDLDDF